MILHLNFFKILLHVEKIHIEGLTFSFHFREDF